jgi:hypothetical protein
VISDRTPILRTSGFLSLPCGYFNVTFPSSLLEVKGSDRPAQGVTQREFCDCMKEIRLEVERRVAQEFKPAKAKKILGVVTYSFDNAAFHQCPDLLEEIAGIQTSQRQDLPAWGPDFQQPIEHAHGRFKSAMRKEVAGGFMPRNLGEMEGKCKEVWKTVNSKKVVSANVRRLKELYEHVHEVSKGDWAIEDLF